MDDLDMPVLDGRQRAEGDNLTLVEVFKGWFTIEWASHDGREWFEVDDRRYHRFCRSCRVSDASVEGRAAEMLALAKAIKEKRVDAYARRCAVRVEGDMVLLWSPRNSEAYGAVSYQSALALASEIEAKLGGQDED